MCVGIDPVIERVPIHLRGGDDVTTIERFSEGVIDAVAGRVPCVKLQSACFERYRAPGVAALDRLIVHALARGLEVILDAKRGDIGISAAHYAEGAFAAGAGWVTISAWLGADGVEPFLRPGHGAFALVRTSNPGGDRVQSAELSDGRTVAHAMAALVAELGRAHVGRRGFSALGAVVGATKGDEAGALRREMPQQILLVPGYGAQGGGVEGVLPCFRADGLGAIVTASRSIIYPTSPEDPAWARAVAEAAERLADEIAGAVGMRAAT